MFNKLLEERFSNGIAKITLKKQEKKEKETQ